MSEARREDSHARMFLDDVFQERAQVANPRVRVVAAVVAAGHDEAGVGWQVDDRGALVVPAPEVLPAETETERERGGRRGEREGIGWGGAISRVLARGRRGARRKPGRVAREARTIARLNHPNIVKVHELGEHEGSWYIAMEYVEGKELPAVSALEAAAR